MTVPTKHRSSSIPLLLLVPALFLVAPALAGEVAPTPPDHYKVYRVQNPVTGGPAIILTDQFGTANHDVLWLEKFQNPVEKKHAGQVFGVTDTTLHYAWWKITDQPFGAIVAVDNQFGNQTLQVDGPQYLLNPALKNEPVQPLQPTRNHYKCYECQGNPVGALVTLTDQFDVFETVAAFPRYLCNPVEKTVVGGPTFPIFGPAPAYVCYTLDPPDPQTFTATFTDQFVQNQPISLNPGELLCVPTDKLGVTATEKSTWGRVKMLYR